MDTPTRQLKDDPNWIEAGNTLVSALASQVSDSDRLAVLLEVCKRFDTELYPAFLKILCAIGHFGTDVARQQVACTLAVALKRSRLPSGRLSAWGLNSTAGRNLGPVEYLCVWYCDQAGPVPLDAEGFTTPALYLSRLIQSDTEATRLYREKLHQDSNASLEGTYSRRSRDLLKAMAACWEQPVDAASLTVCLDQAGLGQGLGGTPLR